MYSDQFQAEIQNSETESKAHPWTFGDKAPTSIIGARKKFAELNFCGSRGAFPKQAAWPLGRGVGDGKGLIAAIKHRTWRVCLEELAVLVEPFSGRAQRRLRLVCHPLRNFCAKFSTCADSDVRIQMWLCTRTQAPPGTNLRRSRQQKRRQGMCRLVGSGFRIRQRTGTDRHRRDSQPRMAA
eukprot:SAG31_NODE_5972_length_2232_cov_1.451008_1_plen_182_part_00